MLHAKKGNKYKIKWSGGGIKDKKRDFLKQM